MLFTLIAMLSFSFVACNKDDDKSSETILEAFGPSPVALGGKITFIGQNLDKVASIEFPMGYTVSTFDEKSSGKIVVTATADSAYAYEGFVKLVLTNGNEVVSKTKIGYYQSALINGFSPAEVKPGKELTLQGVYLSSIKSITFEGGVKVDAEDFVSQKNANLVVRVPMEALSGKFFVNDGTSNIYSDADLKVLAPASIKAASKGSVNGAYLENEVIKLSGSNLDLVKVLKLGDNEISEFVSQTDNELSFKMPRTVGKDDAVSVIAFNDVTVDTDIKISSASATVKVAGWDGKADSFGEITKRYALEEEFSLSGSNLNMLKSITVGGAEVTDLTVSADNKTVSFKIPTSAVPTQKDADRFGASSIADRYERIYDGWQNAFVLYAESFNGEKVFAGYIYNEWGNQFSCNSFSLNKEGTAYEAEISFSDKVEYVQSLVLDDEDYLDEWKANGGKLSIGLKYAKSCSFTATFVNGVKHTGDLTNPAASYWGYKYEVPTYPIMTASFEVEPGVAFEVPGINFTPDCKFVIIDEDKKEYPVTNAAYSNETLVFMKVVGVDPGKYTLKVSNSVGESTTSLKVVGAEVEIWASKEPVTAGWNADVSIMDWSQIKAGSLLTFYADVDLGGYCELFFCTPDWDDATKLCKFKIAEVAADGKYTYTVTADDIAMYSTKGTMVIGNTDGYIKVSKITVLNE